MHSFLFAVLLAFAGAAHALEAGAPVPDLPALSGTRGQVVYVDFWASWCVPCRLSLPTLDALQREHADRGFVVVGVNKDASPADAERFLRRVPVGLRWVSDERDEIARAFDVKAMPSGYLVDRRGKVRRVHRGFTAETAAELAREVSELLGERP